MLARWRPCSTTSGELYRRYCANKKENAGRVANYLRTMGTIWRALSRPEIMMMGQIAYLDAYAASPPPASKPAAASATGATSPPPAPSPSASLDVDDASGAGGVWALRPRPKNPSRSRCTLRWVSWSANAIQQYIRITHSTSPASSAPKLLWCTRAMSASPASALSVTLSAGFFTIASLLSPSLTPMAAPGGLGQLTCALGFWRGQKLLRDRRRLHIRVGFGPELSGPLEGDPNQV